MAGKRFHFYAPLTPALFPEALWEGANGLLLTAQTYLPKHLL